MTETKLLNTFAGKICTNGRILVGMQPDFLKKVLHNIAPKMIVTVIPENIDEKSRITSIIYQKKFKIENFNFISIDNGRAPFLDLLFISKITPQIIILIKNLLTNTYTSQHKTYFVVRRSQKKEIDNFRKLSWERISSDWIYAQYSYKTKYKKIEKDSLFVSEEDLLYMENDDV